MHMTSFSLLDHICDLIGWQEGTLKGLSTKSSFATLLYDTLFLSILTDYFYGCIFNLGTCLPCVQLKICWCSFKPPPAILTWLSHSYQQVLALSTNLSFKIVFKTGFLYCSMLSSSGEKELMHFLKSIFLPTQLWKAPSQDNLVYSDFDISRLCKSLKVKVKDAQSCPTLFDPMDCSLPGFSVHGIFQARIVEWVAISFSM